MQNTFVKTGSLARLSGDIDDLFNQLDKKICPTLGPTCRGCPDCGPVMGDSTYREVFEKNAAAPVQVVPTSSGSSRPHVQSNINSVFKIPYSPDAEFKTLCQDCLRVVCHPTREAMYMADGEFFFCDCGGQLCACENCLDKVNFFARNGSAAIVELARLGAIKPITGPFIYSPATGIVREQSK